MRGLGFSVVLAALAIPFAAAAQTPVVPPPPYYAVGPNQPLVPQAAGSPLQQQVLQNYRTQLLQTQRDSVQQNPSGIGREQLDITGRLNGYNAPPPAPYVPPPPPGGTPLPVAGR